MFALAYVCYVMRIYTEVAFILGAKVARFPDGLA